MSAQQLDPLDLYDVRSELSEDEAMVKDTVARFVDDQVIPLMREAFEQHRFPQQLVAEVAALHHGAGLTDQRVAGVVVGQAEHGAGVAHLVDELHGLVNLVGQRLVTDDVEAVLQRREAVFVVAVGGGHDGDDVGAGSPGVALHPRLDLPFARMTSCPGPPAPTSPSWASHRAR